MFLLKADSWYVGHAVNPFQGHIYVPVRGSMAYAKIIQPCPQAFPGLKQVGLGSRLNLVILNLTFTHWFTSRPFSISLAISYSITN